MLKARPPKADALFDFPSLDQNVMFRCPGRPWSNSYPCRKVAKTDSPVDLVAIDSQLLSLMQNVEAGANVDSQLSGFDQLFLHQSGIPVRLWFLNIGDSHTVATNRRSFQLDDDLPRIVVIRQADNVLVRKLCLQTVERQRSIHSAPLSSTIPEYLPE